MNELREQIQGLIDKHDVDSYRASVGAEHSSYPSAAVTTDRILALIAEAMLSEDVYRAMADGVDRLLPEAERDMRAALAAAGITPGDAREGGEEVFNCPNCEGTGLYDDCTCSVCEGEGELTQRQWDGK